MGKAKYAYAIWPWGLETKDQMIKALKEVKAVGFQAFESVESAVDLFLGRVAEFKAIIDEHGVRPVSFYFWLTGEQSADVERVKSKIEFLAANDVHRMSVQAAKANGTPATPEQLKNTLITIERIGAVASQFDVTPCVHPHHNTLIMYENEIDFIMQNTDPQVVAFGPDTAHLAAGRCDPVQIFKRYEQRIAFTHLKDLKADASLEADEKGDFHVYNDFMELGEGDLDFGSIFKILDGVDYGGYLTVELDRTRSTHAESAAMSMEYLRTNYGAPGNP